MSKVTSRIRRTAKQKSPPAMELPQRSWVTQPTRRPVASSGTGGSPLLSRQSISRGGVLFDDVKYSGYTGQREKQVSRLTAVTCVATTPFM